MPEIAGPIRTPGRSAGYCQRSPEQSSSRELTAGDEFREGLLRLGAPDDVRRVVPLLGPLLFEVLSHLVEQQCLEADHRGAVVAGDHAGKLHGLGPQLLARDQMVQQTDAVRFFGFVVRTTTRRARDRSSNSATT